jgi:hypothetical protein
MSIGVTVPEVQFSAYAVLPSGVTAMALGFVPTGIGVPGVLVAVAIGVTVPGVQLVT